MYRILLVCVLLGGMGYLYMRKSPAATEQELPAPPPLPPALQHMPPQVLGEAQIEKIRLATLDGDPQVRWAAIDLLYRIRDPRAYEILKKALVIDSESSVRQKSLDIIKNVDSPNRVKVLISALNDTERNIRIAALVALGEIGDPNSTAAIVEILRDPDPIVRRQAINTLGIIQTKQDLEHSRMQDKIREQYEKELAEHNRQAGGLTSPIKHSEKDLLEKNRVE
ncbi:MAG: HEAT repeat domain-containing protein [Elusimicrobiota bacterium]